MKAAYLCRRQNGELQSTKDDIFLMMDNLVKSNKMLFVSLADVPAKEYFNDHILWIPQIPFLSPQPKLFLMMLNVKILMRNQIFHSLLSR